MTIKQAQDDLTQREQSLEKVRLILAMSKELETSGYRDLESRAQEIGALAHWMLYDVHDCESGE